MLFRFRNFQVYKDAKGFRLLIKELLQKFPEKERFSLTEQINRAGDSICLNIAEGSNRLTDKDKAHFLNQALTSLEEIVAGFDLALDSKYIMENDMSKIINGAENLGKQLIGFSKSLKNS